MPTSRGGHGQVIHRGAMAYAPPMARGLARIACAAWMAVCVAAVPAAAVAQQPIVDNDFSVDAVDGPVLGSSREVGMAGAHTALAAGAGGAPFNPAAFATRAIYEIEPWAWDIALSYFFPGVGSANDFFDNGSRGADTTGFHFADVGGRLQFKDGGAGVLVRTLAYGLEFEDGSSFRVDLVVAHVGLGYGLFDGQLTIGLGSRIANMNIVQDAGTMDDAELVDFTGAGLEVGAVLGLEGLPFRVGASLRSAVDSRVVEDPNMPVPSHVGSVLLPHSVHLPWEVEVGLAWQLGPRPLNGRYLRYKAAGPRVERELADRPDAGDRADEAQDRVEDEAHVHLRSLPRRYLLLSGSVLVTGPTNGGVGIDAFLEQEVRPRGVHTSATLRLGAEAEVVPDWLRLRTGFYLEPGRQVGVGLRPHVTGGFTARLFTVFGYTLAATFTLDGAPRYVDLGVGVGLWH